LVVTASGGGRQVELAVVLRGSGSMSSMAIMSFTPPTPSVMAWWILTIRRGSVAVESLDDGELPQRAARSNPCIAIGAAVSSTSQGAGSDHA
jgi:hypothetical protein